jgi:hypothetical protein
MPRKTQTHAQHTHTHTHRKREREREKERERGRKKGKCKKRDTNQKKQYSQTMISELMPRGYENMFFALFGITNRAVRDLLICFVLFFISFITITIKSSP